MTKLIDMGPIYLMKHRYTKRIQLSTVKKKLHIYFIDRKRRKNGKIFWQHFFIHFNLSNLFRSRLIFSIIIFLFLHRISDNGYTNSVIELNGSYGFSKYMYVLGVEKKNGANILQIFFQINKHSIKICFSSDERYSVFFMFPYCYFPCSGWF